MLSTDACFTPPSVRKSPWPPSPCKGKGSRSTPTGASFRPSPDIAVGSAEARARTTAKAAAHRIATQPEQAYNLCLSEMRHYQDDDTMVLVLSQRAGAVQEAEYPVPLEQDTSEILDAEDDDVLAGYAEAASRLLKPSTYTELTVPGLSKYRVPREKPFKYDDVSHELFDSETYEVPSTQGLTSDAAGSSRRKQKDLRVLVNDDEERSAEDAFDSQRALFRTDNDPVSSSSTCLQDQAVVDEQRWSKSPAAASSRRSNSKRSSSSNGRHLLHEAHPNSHVRVSNGATSQRQGHTEHEPFFPSSPTSRESYSTTPPRNPRDSFQSTEPQDAHLFYPSSPVAPRVNNGARPKVNNGMSKKTSRAEIRERRAAERAEQGTQLPTEPSPTEQPPSSSQSFNPASQPEYQSGVVRSFWDSGPHPSSEYNSEEVASAPVESPTDRQRNETAEPAPPGEPFFPKSATKESHSQADAVHAQFQWSRPAGVRDFFEPRPADSAPTSAADDVPASDTPSAQDVVEVEQSRTRSQRSSGLVFHTAAAHQREHKQLSTAAPAVERLSTRGSPGLVDSKTHIDHTNGVVTGLEDLDIQDEHHDASRSFARAVSISSLETVVPGHSARGRSSPRNSAMRRSSRRDAHMKARIATLDTSNLSAYSLATLKRLAKDLGLSNTCKLSKSELVVQLVSEIILANMSLGWGAPEVAQGVLAEDYVEDGYSSSDDEDATVFKFAGGGGQQREVTVEEAVPHATLQRGRDSIGRLSLEHGGDHASVAQSGASRVGTAVVAPWQQHDVDSDFENMSKLSMSELQQMCEDMNIEGWASMRKFEMISRLLMDVYEVER